VRDICLIGWNLSLAGAGRWEMGDHSLECFDDAAKGRELFLGERD
jgi:hypothetical protein